MAEPTMEEVVNLEGDLQPCGICGRTFLPQPLAKHMKVCERNATRKRKVFNSLKQRVEGTEFAQFHQRSYLKKQNTSTTPEAPRQSSKWREKHQELVNTIRAARGEPLPLTQTVKSNLHATAGLPVTMPTSPKRGSSNTAGGERCPSCDRQFGPRAFDRHVEWCKEHKTRIHRSPAEVLLAKERLEARTKYRVPLPSKSKRTLVRDKYSPGTTTKAESTTNLKSASTPSLDRSPSIRKSNKSLHNLKKVPEIEHDDVSAEIHNKCEESSVRIPAKEKHVPKEPRGMPVIDSIKSPGQPRIIKAKQKLNTTQVNSTVEGMMVSSMSSEQIDKEPKRMVTWRDTVYNSPTGCDSSRSGTISTNIIPKKCVSNQTKDVKKVLPKNIIKSKSSVSLKNAAVVNVKLDDEFSCISEDFREPEDDSNLKSTSRSKRNEKAKCTRSKNLSNECLLEEIHSVDSLEKSLTKPLPLPKFDTAKTKSIKKQPITRQVSNLSGILTEDTESDDVPTFNSKLSGARKTKSLVPIINTKTTRKIPVCSKKPKNYDDIPVGTFRNDDITDDASDCDVDIRRSEPLLPPVNQVKLPINHNEIPVGGNRSRVPINYDDIPVGPSRKVLDIDDETEIPNIETETFDHKLDKESDDEKVCIKPKIRDTIKTNTATIKKRSFFTIPSDHEATEEVSEYDDEVAGPSNIGRKSKFRDTINSKTATIRKETKTNSRSKMKNEDEVLVSYQGSGMDLNESDCSSPKDSLTLDETPFDCKATNAMMKNDDEAPAELSASAESDAKPTSPLVPPFSRVVHSPKQSKIREVENSVKISVHSNVTKFNSTSSEEQSSYITDPYLDANINDLDSNFEGSSAGTSSLPSISDKACNHSGMVKNKSSTCSFNSSSSQLNMAKDVKESNTLEIDEPADFSKEENASKVYDDVEPGFKMYDSQELKKCGILNTVQEICKRERYNANIDDCPQDNDEETEQLQNVKEETPSTSQDYVDDTLNDSNNDIDINLQHEEAFNKANVTWFGAINPSFGVDRAVNNWKTVVKAKTGSCDANFEDSGNVMVFTGLIENNEDKFVDQPQIGDQIQAYNKMFEDIEKLPSHDGEDAQPTETNKLSSFSEDMRKYIEEDLEKEVADFMLETEGYRNLKNYKEEIDYEEVYDSEEETLAEAETEDVTKTEPTTDLESTSNTTSNKDLTIKKSASCTNITNYAISYYSNDANQRKEDDQSTNVPEDLASPSSSNDTEDLKMKIFNESLNHAPNYSHCNTKWHTYKTTSFFTLDIIPEDDQLQLETSVLYKSSQEISDIESLNCEDVDVWNETLSMARTELSVRRCTSAVTINLNKPPYHNNFCTYTELDLTKYNAPCFGFTSQENELTSDRILEIAGDEFVSSFNEPKLDSKEATPSSSTEVIPTKRRKLSDSDDFTTPSICSSLDQACESNLIQNLERIKLLKSKVEQGRCDYYPVEAFENNIGKGDDAFVGKSYKTDVRKYISSPDETAFELENIEQMGQFLDLTDMYNNSKMRNKGQQSVSSTSLSSCPIQEVSPRLSEVINCILNEDRRRSKHKNYRNQDMLTISKEHCRKLLELDPHVIDLSRRVKLPHINSRQTKQTEVQTKKSNCCTLPPISKIPVIKDCRSKKPCRDVFTFNSIESDPAFPQLLSPSDKQSDYNPFVTAERQLMELLECDDFKPFFSKPSTQLTPQRPHTTTNTNLKPIETSKNNKVVKSAENTRKKHLKTDPNSKRTSVIDPPMDFQDKLNLMSDDFELIESLINQNYIDGLDLNVDDLNEFNFESLSSKLSKSFYLEPDANENERCTFTAKERKYSDDMTSIDPRLINENDNLSIPENLKADNYSTHSSNDNLMPIISNINKKIEPKRVAKSTAVEKMSRSLDAPDSIVNKKAKQINLNRRAIKSTKQITDVYKSTASLTSSTGATRCLNSSDKKKNLSSLKRSVSLVDPVKPKNMKNKQDVQNYFDKQEKKNTKKERASPERQIQKSPKCEINNVFTTPTAEELFAVDDEMYEEYKKYEEMYLREKQMQNEKKQDEFISSGTLTPNEGSDNVPPNNKVSADSAYSSLNRKAPKVRARSTKLAPLERQRSETSPVGSPTSSGSDTSPSFFNKHSTPSKRMSKFCHECGNKFPINTAKFCVECGVKRLVL